MKEVKESHLRFRQEHFEKCVHMNMGSFILISKSFAECLDTRREIIQQAITDVWKNLSKLNDEAFYAVKVKAYVGKAVYNEGIKYQTRVRKNPTTENIDDYVKNYEDENANQYSQKLQYNLQQNDVVNYFIDKAQKIKILIGDEKFEILMMWGVDEKSYDEIAVITGKSEASIRNLIFNIRKKLRENAVKGEL